MRGTWIVLAGLLTAIAPPKRFYFRFVSQAPSAQRSEIEGALRRGLFMDSVIVAGPRKQFTAPGAPVDSTARANSGQTMLVLLAVADSGQRIMVTVTVKNVLARTVAGPETVRVERPALDSALVEAGRRIARALAR